MSKLRNPHWPYCQEGLKHLRQKAGVTIEHLSYRIDLSIGYISEMERSLRPMPKPEILRRWAKGIGLKPPQARKLMESCDRYDGIYVRHLQERVTNLIAKHNYDLEKRDLYIAQVELENAELIIQLERHRKEVKRLKALADGVDTK